MKTAGEFRAEAARLRELAKTVDQDELRDAILELLDEVERYLRHLENGSS
ncbi:MAG TPA: hypothetical protein VFW46_03495 [Stellaceae bacterium]|jgi:hypothetical protein|nr:hypothetical protein [Stellaceae bacterium]